MLDNFMYMGRFVIIPDYAEVPQEFQPGGKYARYVQDILDTTPPWGKKDSPIEIMDDLGVEIPLDVVELSAEMRERIVWAQHGMHTARTVGLSPFVDVDRPPLTSTMTIELANTSMAPKLVRAYLGDYRPPLPWQGSAVNADGGYRVCLDYWRTHAYVYDPVWIGPTRSLTYSPPDWYTE